ncbi:MAG TPA: flavohemoprotein [Candidatus Corynebacterium gallistercoris]|uniref:Flavohemoprotein n=1 Tax=Candidatus Corynebacterium gallistercoris TaxID=2838530 RepID=A0A9D1RZA5_9CORY|nr:flavohemoprotein [Candidatus Corynebacterium gallistercoris]
MARHGQDDQRSLTDLLQESVTLRPQILATTKELLAAADLHPAPVALPRAGARTHGARPAGAPQSASAAQPTSASNPTFAQTFPHNPDYINTVLDFLRAGVTPAGEFEQAQGEFLVATGKDLRKYGIEQEHYAALSEALLESISTYIDGSKELCDLAELACSLLAFGAEEDRQADVPATTTATVLDVEHRCSTIAVVRVQMDPVLPFWAGQYLEVRTPYTPDGWRRLSPATTCNDDGLVEFHIRAVRHVLNETADDALEFGEQIVSQAQPGDQWVFANPYGQLHISGGKPVVLVGGSTGLAPLRALILELSAEPNPPSVHLVAAAHNPGELYDYQTLQGFDQAFDWLTVTFAVEQSRVPAGTNPMEYTEADAAELEWATPRDGWILGTAAEVAPRHTSWQGAEIIICGSATMKRTTAQAFIDAGAAEEQIQMDPSN